MIRGLPPWRDLPPWYHLWHNWSEWISTGWLIKVSTGWQPVETRFCVDCNRLQLRRVP